MIRLAQNYRAQLLTLSIGIMYVWFGGLKFIPGMSPADALAKETIQLLTFNLIPAPVSIILLAIWEVSIGLMLILKFRTRTAIHLALVHLAFTFTPFILLPALSYRENLFELTLVGQYIIKNLVILAALLFIYPEKKKLKAAAVSANSRIVSREEVTA